MIECFIFEGSKATIISIGVERDNREKKARQLRTYEPMRARKKKKKKQKKEGERVERGDVPGICEIATPSEIRALVFESRRRTSFSFSRPFAENEQTDPSVCWGI